MNNSLNKSGGIELLKGLIAIILAIIVFSNPAKALVTLATWLGVLALIVGAVMIFMALWKKRGSWQMLLAQGIFNAILGLLVVAYPRGSAGLVIFIAGIWITVFGIIQLFAYMQAKEVLPGKSLILLSALLSLLVGVLLMFNPFEGAVMVTVILGIYAVIIGVSKFYVAWLMYRQK